MRHRLSAIDRLAIAEKLKEDINAFCVKLYPNDHRNHLGASEIGEPCARRLWYSFRWMMRETFTGDDRKMLRLFNRGHETEPRYIEWLEGIGCKISSHSDDGNQWRISKHQQHFGGSLDGRIWLPESYNLPVEFLWECKTHNDKSFKKLVKTKNLSLSKPKHFAQMNTYGSDEIYNLDYGIYCAINKNDDEIYIEIVTLDHEAGKKNVRKAGHIIFSQTAPGRISASPAFDECKYCPMGGICHKGEQPNRNCRSCINAVPLENAEWRCNKFNMILPKENIQYGCDQWQSVEHK